MDAAKDPAGCEYGGVDFMSTVSESEASAKLGGNDSTNMSKDGILIVPEQEEKDGPKKIHYEKVNPERDEGPHMTGSSGTDIEACGADRSKAHPMNDDTNDGGPEGLKIQLRRHKDRIIGYVDTLMPWHTLEIGTTILVMQQSPSSASVRSEITTSIAIVFPRPKGGGTGRKVMEGIKESSKGGTFRVCISKVAADVTREDVLDALPPAFPGGRGKLPIKRGRQRKQGRLNEAASKLTNHTGSGGSPNATAATSLMATSDAS